MPHRYCEPDDEDDNDDDEKKKNENPEIWKFINRSRRNMTCVRAFRLFLAFKAIAKVMIVY